MKYAWGRDTKLPLLSVKKVFDSGAFEGDCEKFHSDIMDAVALAMNPQRPDHMVIGVPNTDFDSETPFKIK